MTENEALSRLRDILASPEYHVDPSRPWWDQVLGPLGDLIAYVVFRFVQTVLDTASGREGWFGLGVLAVCGLLIVPVLVYLGRAVRLSVMRDGRVRLAKLAERRERSERLWQQAQQLAAEGRLAEAVRAVYLSALYALDERALLHIESSLTNLEHARQLNRLHPELGQAFLEVVQQYDRVRYGRVPVTQREPSSPSHASFAELSDLVARVRAASLQGSAA